MKNALLLFGFILALSGLQVAHSQDNTASDTQQGDVKIICDVDH